MALFYADIQTTVNGPAFGQPLATRLKANKLNGRLRYFESLFVAPASGTAPAIADKIIWGKLPVRSRVINHASKLYWNTGTASSTLNLGDNVSAARYLAATAITSTGNAVPEANALINAGTGNVTLGSNVITGLTSIGAFQVGANITGTGIPTGTLITSVQVSTTAGASQCTISAVATATNSTVALTTLCGGYEVTDDSNSVANAFASTTDDCTLVSVVAGAQIANNQALVLKIAYVQD